MGNSKKFDIFVWAPVPDMFFIASYSFLFLFIMLSSANTCESSSSCVNCLRII